MKRSLVLAVALFACAGGRQDASVDDAALSADALEVPFYFALPKSALPEPPTVNGYRSFRVTVRESLVAEHAGLNVIAVPDRTSTDGRKQVRREMTQKLADAGLLRDGDVVVGVRFNQKDSVPYVHLQMGAQHTGLIFTRGGVAHHVDEPLDLEHMSFDPPASSVPAERSRDALGPPSSFRARKIVARFDSDAYVKDGTSGMPMLHIVRPRFLDDVRVERMRAWIERIGERWEYLQAAGVLRYNPNFLAPAAPRLGGTRKSVTLLGKTLLGDALPGELDMYCSELSWHLLALSNCSEDDVRSAPTEGAACAADVPFALQPLASTEQAIGFTEGPLAIMREAGLDVGAAAPLLRAVFPARPDASRLTNLHRRMNDQFRDLVPMMSAYYEARLGGAPDVWERSREANRRMNDVENYAPTSFLIEALKPTSERKFDYIATVVFVDR